MNKRILLTRSTAENESVARVLGSLDCETVSLPLIDIANTSDLDALKIIREEIQQFDIFIFVSVHAVRSGIHVLLEKKENLKDTAVFMAVGERTAAELHEFVPSVLFPESGVGGEALMNSEEMSNLTGKRVMIVRGKHGKAWLGKEVERRGGKLDYFDCYRRRQPRFLETSLNKHFSDEMYDVCLLHSSHAASNLIESSGAIRPSVLNSAAVVGSNDIRELLLKFGWSGVIIVANSPSNKDMLIALSALI